MHQQRSRLVRALRLDLVEIFLLIYKEDAATYCLRSSLHQRNPEHFAQLKEALNAPISSYGINIDWSKYSATDAIDVLFDYLKSLRETLLPIDLICKLPSLDNYQQRNYVPSDWDSLQVYAICLAKMPECNRQLLLVLLGFIASQIEIVGRTLCDNDVGFHNEAALRWSFVLCHRLDYRTATFTLLLVNAVYFLRKANGKAPTHTEWEALIKVREELAAEAEFLPLESAASTEGGLLSDLKHEAAHTASLAMQEQHAQDQIQGNGSTRAEDKDNQRLRAKDYKDSHGNGDRSELAHQSDADDAASEGYNEPPDSPVENSKLALEDETRSPARGRSLELLDFDDNGSDDMVKVCSTAQVEETDHIFQSLLMPIPDGESPRPSLSESPTDAEPGIAVEPSPDHALVNLQQNDDDVHKQTTMNRDQDPVQPVVPRPQTPAMPGLGVNQSHWESMQYCVGISSPPTPKSETKVSRTRLPKLSISTPVDDAMFVGTPSDDQSQEERLTPIQTEHLGPLQPPFDLGRRDQKDAEATIHKQRSHRNSGGRWTYHPNHSKTKSLGGESIGSEKRKSRDEERNRSRDEGEMQAAQKNDQAGRRQQRKKSNASFRNPERGFREWFHGVGKRK